MYRGLTCLANIGQSGATLLTSEKNKYFDLVRRRKLDPASFAVEVPEPRARYNRGQSPIQEWEPALRLTHESALFFEIHDSGLPGYPDRREYQCYWNTYEPAHMKVTSASGYSGYKPIDGASALKLFDDWLANHVVTYEQQRTALAQLKKREETTPDLWRLALSMVGSHSIAQEIALNADELESAIQLLREYITKTYAPSPEQTVVVDRNLSVMRDDLSRRPPTDWRGIVIGTLINVAVALYLNNEQGRQLFEFAKELFARFSDRLLN